MGAIEGVNITLNLNISASGQNIKNLVCNFGAIHVRIMHSNFLYIVSSFTGGGGENEVTDRRIQDVKHS